MKKLLLNVVFVGLAYFAHAQLAPNSLVSAGHGTIHFYQFKPPHYKTGTPGNPLIISLGGVGERGDGSPAQLPNLFAGGIPKLLSQGATMEFTVGTLTEGFVVLAPQLSDGSAWQNYYVDEMINYGINNLNVDPNRIFLTGYSLGGVGTWAYPTASDANAAKLAGIVPISAGSPNAPNWCAIASNKVATWAFQTKNDEAYGNNAAKPLIAAINSCPVVNIPAVDSTYENGSHGAGFWDGVVYDTTNSHEYPNIYQWMLKVRRDLKVPPDNANPIAANAGGTVITINTPVKVKDFQYLDARASSDAEDIVMEYYWEQQSAPVDPLFPASGPVSFKFGSDPGLSPAFTFQPVAGILSRTNYLNTLPVGDYSFRLRVKDYLTSKPGHTQFTTVTVKVQLPTIGHSAPGVYAGNDKVLASTDLYIPILGEVRYYGTINTPTVNWRYIKGPAIPIGSPQPGIEIYNGGAAYVSGSNDPNARMVNMAIPGTYEFEISANNGFSEIGRDTLVLTRLGSALPVNYAYFKGENAGSKNTLTWATTSEINSDRFDIQRSTDGLSFTTVGTVASKGGAIVTEYSFDDNNAPAGVSYYRLSQVDKDGHAALSKTISINNRKTGVYIEQYPNPVHDNLTVNVQGVVTGKIKMIVADMQGKTIMQQEWQKDQTSLKKIIGVGSLQNGVYQMIISIGQEKTVSSFVKY